MTRAAATPEQQRYYAKPPTGQEIPWWMPTVELPDGTYVPLLSSDGLDYFVADELFGHFLVDFLFDPIVDGWYVQTHPDDAAA